MLALDLMRLRLVITTLAGSHSDQLLLSLLQFLLLSSDQVSKCFTKPSPLSHLLLKSGWTSFFTFSLPFSLTS